MRGRDHDPARAPGLRGRRARLPTTTCSARHRSRAGRSSRGSRRGECGSIIATMDDYLMNCQIAEEQCSTIRPDGRPDLLAGDPRRAPARSTGPSRGEHGHLQKGRSEGHADRRDRPDHGLRDRGAGPHGHVRERRVHTGPRCALPVQKADRRPVRPAPDRPSRDRGRPFQGRAPGRGARGAPARVAPVRPLGRGRAGPDRARARGHGRRPREPDPRPADPARRGERPRRPRARRQGRALGTPARVPQARVPVPRGPDTGDDPARLDQARPLAGPVDPRPRSTGSSGPSRRSCSRRSSSRSALRR